MRLATVIAGGNEKLAVCMKKGLILMAEINGQTGSAWPERMDELIKSEQLAPLNRWYKAEGKSRLEESTGLLLKTEEVHYAPLYRTPPKIWGIGLNYTAHAEDLSEKAPTGLPASFMKPATTIIGYGDDIRIPKLSQKTTAEAELGVVIGKCCKDVSRENWQDCVAGFTPIIDMTAEDILRQNPRYLTVSKSFDTFFSIGPQLVTTDEVEDLNLLAVATVINGRVHAANTVSRMTFPPDELVAFHSKVMTLVPGDVISTGTPGAVQIHHGDEIQCTVTGFETLKNRVVDLKH
jgi:2-keto-4-pentenoate hydratase/2-oxohepta-3-ene-1,7-dioic acid hydratase in catechol pathway